MSSLYDHLSTVYDDLPENSTYSSITTTSPAIPNQDSLPENDDIPGRNVII